MGFAMSWNEDPKEIFLTLKIMSFKMFLGIEMGF